MGACISSSASVIDNNDKFNYSALIISVAGNLRQYPLPVTSSQILHMEALSPTAFFICDSDNLFYDDFISAVDLEEVLEAGQIYFIIPTEKLQYRLSAADMAALAVKASVALNNTSPLIDSSSSYNPSSSPSISNSIDTSNDQQINSSRRMNINKARISPFVLMEANQINVVDHRHSSTCTSNNNNNNSSSRSSSTRSDHHQGGKKKMLRSGSNIRKLSRASSRRARLAVRSFRLSLSTIYEEGNVLQVY